MRIAIWLAFGAIASAASAGLGLSASAQTSSVSADPCDVSGVRLGMSAAETSAALKAKLGPAAEIKQHLFPSELLGRNYVRALDYQSGSTSIQVELVENVPPDQDRGEAAWKVEYKIDNPTSADKAGFKAEAVEKYGPPSSGALMHWSQCPHLEFGPNYLALLNADYITKRNTYRDSLKIERPPL